MPDVPTFVVMSLDGRVLDVIDDARSWHEAISWGYLAAVQDRNVSALCTVPTDGHANAPLGTRRARARERGQLRYGPEEASR